MSFFVFRGWIPVDEGLLAQTAERVLAGELPHRDFDDCYTGGLALLYAAAFQALGIKLTLIRVVFFLAAAMMVPPTFSIARRAASPGWRRCARCCASPGAFPTISPGCPVGTCCSSRFWVSGPYSDSLIPAGACGWCWRDCVAVWLSW